MTARSSSHRHYQAEQLLIEGRRKMIRECCLSSPLGLNPDFYVHSWRHYATISHWGTKLEIDLFSGAWYSKGVPPVCGVITGARENFLLVLEKAFPGKNMCGT